MENWWFSRWEEYIEADRVVVVPTLLAKQVTCMHLCYHHHHEKGIVRGLKILLMVCRYCCIVTTDCRAVMFNQMRSIAIYRNINFRVESIPGKSAWLYSTYSWALFSLISYENIKELDVSPPFRLNFPLNLLHTNMSFPYQESSDWMRCSMKKQNKCESVDLVGRSLFNRTHDIAETERKYVGNCSIDIPNWFPLCVCGCVGNSFKHMLQLAPAPLVYKPIVSIIALQRQRQGVREGNVVWVELNHSWNRTLPILNEKNVLECTAV